MDTVQLFPAPGGSPTGADLTDDGAGSGGAVGGRRWPREVELILSAMDVAEESAAPDRRSRRAQRQHYRAEAKLHLFSDQLGSPPWTLYTRDVSPRGMGFVTPHRLPLGYGGWVELLSPQGRLMRIHCTLYRCREAVKGWFEGSLQFNREQFAFAAERLVSA